MKIESLYCLELLAKLRDYFPHMLGTDGYKQLLDQSTEDKLDGHLIYLYQKGLISTEMSYRYEDEHNPIRSEGGWTIKSHYTSITAAGLDYLISKNS